MPYVTENDLFRDRVRSGDVPTVLEYRSSGLDRFQSLYGEWARQTFPDASQESCIAHLLAEVRDEINPLCDDSELADAALLLLHIAHIRGRSLDTLMKTKAVVNMNRKWSTKPNAEGFFPHIQSEPDHA